MGFPSRIKPKKSLGQNFFSNNSLGEKIVNIVTEESPNHITEIGPGLGFFTKKFLERDIKISVIEKDDDMVEGLKEKFPSIEIVNADMLDYDISGLETSFFGSLPYNVSKPIIRRIITSESFKNKAFFIIQKEVAQKYVAPDNILGLTSALYAKAKVLFDISPGSFNPKPKVTSSFVKFEPNETYQNIHREEVEKLIKLAFSHPRKTLNNNIKGSKYILEPNEANRRPGELSLDEYILISSRS